MTSKPLKERIEEKKERRRKRKKRAASRKYYVRRKRREEKRKALAGKKSEVPKKMGRPKKRGPKKKRCRRKVVKSYKERPVIDFKIVTTLNGRQNGFVGYYSTYEEAYEALNGMMEKDRSVVFPREVLNSSVMSESKEEYLLLEKNRDGVRRNTKLRDEYGKFIPQIIENNDTWMVRDKADRRVEETFWMYGFDPKTDRKKFDWIYGYVKENMVKERYDIVRTALYKNKIVFLNDANEPEIVFCKNVSDAIRFYNKVKEYAEAEKNRNIFFVGSYSAISESRRWLEDILMKHTGWSKTKIQYSHT